MQRGLFSGIAFGVIMVIFTLQNPDKVPVKFLWLKFNDAPLALVIVIAILIGVMITAIFAFIDNQKLKNRLKRLQTKIKELEDHTSEDHIQTESTDFNSDHSMTIEGEPNNKFFD